MTETGTSDRNGLNEARDNVANQLRLEPSSFRHITVPLNFEGPTEKRQVLIHVRHDWLRDIGEAVGEVLDKIATLEVRFLSLPDLLPLIPQTHRGFGLLMGLSSEKIELLFLEDSQPADYHSLELNLEKSQDSIKSQLQASFAKFQDRYQRISALDYFYVCSASSGHNALLQLASEIFGIPWIRLELARKIYDLTSYSHSPQSVALKGKSSAEAATPGKVEMKSGGNKPARRAVTQVKPLAEEAATEKKLNTRYVFYGLALVAFGGLYLYEPSEEGTNETKVTEQMMQDPMTQLGIPKGTPDDYRKILEHLEKLKADSIAKGTTLPAFQEKQLSHLQQMKAKGDI